MLPSIVTSTSEPGDPLLQFEEPTAFPSLQFPVPVVGALPAKVAVVTPQAGVWSGPAAATVGASFTTTDAVFTAGAAPQALLAVKV